MVNPKQQGWLSEIKNPKTEQTINLLKINNNFLKDVNIVRKKWHGFINQYKMPINQLVEGFFKIAYQGYLNKKQPSSPYTKVKKLLFSYRNLTRNNLFANTRFNRDVLNLCRKYKLYPMSMWYYGVTFFIITNNFFPPAQWGGMGLTKYSSSEEISQIPKDMNFDLQITTNSKTKEPELWIHVYENTSLKDLKKHWKIINTYQNKLKQIKKIEKRYYPHKNLAIEKQLAELDKTKLSDWEKQEKLYGEITSVDFGRKERQRRARIETIRHRSKKRLT